METDFGAKLSAAMAKLKIEQLRQRHAEAKTALRFAVADDSDLYDFQVLKANVHTLARELAAAEEESAA